MCIKETFTIFSKLFRIFLGSKFLMLTTLNNEHWMRQRYSEVNLFIALFRSVYYKVCYIGLLHANDTVFRATMMTENKFLTKNQFVFDSTLNHSCRNEIQPFEGKFSITTFLWTRAQWNRNLNNSRNTITVWSLWK